MSSALTALGLSFEMDQTACKRGLSLMNVRVGGRVVKSGGRSLCLASQAITQAMKKTADCYFHIGNMFEEQVSSANNR